MKTNLKGQVAVVTGGGSGIGRGVAEELAKRGCQVGLIDIMPQEDARSALEAIVRHGAQVVYEHVDVRNRAAVNTAAERIRTRLGPVSIVVSNAITSQRHDFLHTSFDELQQAVEVGIYGAFHVLQAFTRQMIEAQVSGSIIQMTSPWAYLPYAGGMDYRVVKSAQENMALSLATELMRVGIRVNVVEPGWVNTSGEQRWYTQDEMAQAGRHMPLGRLCTVEDIGRAVAYLCEEPYITGTHLKIDGGLSLAYFEASGGPGTKGGSA